MPSDEEKIAATKSLMFFGISAMALWVGLGTASFWLINSTVGLLFLGFAAFAILMVLRRQMCNSCYYCKSCTKGFAKSSQLFIGKSHIPGIGKGSEVGMAVFVYIAFSVVPSILLTSLILQEVTPLKLALMASLIAIAVANLANRIRSW